MQNKSEMDKEINRFREGLINKLECTINDIQNAIIVKHEDYLSAIGLFDAYVVQDIALRRLGRELSQSELSEVLEDAVFEHSLFGGMVDVVSDAIDKIITNKTS